MHSNSDFIDVYAPYLCKKKFCNSENQVDREIFSVRDDRLPPPPPPHSQSQHIASQFHANKQKKCTTFTVQVIHIPYQCTNIFFYFSPHKFYIAAASKLRQVNKKWANLNDTIKI